MNTTTEQIERNAGLEAIARRDRMARLLHWSSLETWERLVADIPTLTEERWRIIPPHDKWVVRYEPINHPKLWRDLQEFVTEEEALAYVKTL